MGGSPGGFDMNNPMIMGLMSLFASQNPQTAGPMLDKLGIPPPMGLGGPQPGQPLQGAGTPTGPPTDIMGGLGQYLKNTVAGPEENTPPSMRPHEIAPQQQYSSQLQNQPAAPPTMEQIAPEPPTMGDPNFGQTAGPPSPSSMSPSIAAMMQPTAAAPPQIPPFETTVQPEMQPTAAPGAPKPAGGMDPAQLAKLAAFAGVKAPQSIQPIMPQGAAPRAPQVELGGGFGTGVPPGIAMLLQSMAGGQRQNPLIAPDLGSLIRGRG